MYEKEKGKKHIRLRNWKDSWIILTTSVHIVMSMAYLAPRIQLIDVPHRGSRLFNKELRNSFRRFRTRGVLRDFHVVYIVMFPKQYVNDGSTRRMMGGRRKIVARIVSIRM